MNTTNKIWTFLKIIMVIIIIYLIILFLFEWYLKSNYMSECLSNGKNENWCERTWFELRMME